MANQQNSGSQGRPGSSSSDNKKQEDKSAASSKDNGKSDSESTRGGTPEQHAEAGRQSHKNDK